MDLLRVKHTTTTFIETVILNCTLDDCPTKISVVLIQQN